MSEDESELTSYDRLITVVPRHVAIIMDGNNRWAKREGVPGPSGHRAGVEAVRGILRACRRHGVEVLTLFAFSSENWGRPMPEVRALLALLSRYLRNEVRELHEDDIRLRFIGQRQLWVIHAGSGQMGRIPWQDQGWQLDPKRHTITIGDQWHRLADLERGLSAGLE